MPRVGCVTPDIEVYRTDVGQKTMRQRKTNYDDPAVETAWIVEQRRIVTDYLDEQECRHGGVAARPSWFVVPYVAIWSVHSRSNPDQAGWWTISGDLPTDYIGGNEARDARSAMRVFAQHWRKVSACMERGTAHPDSNIGRPENQKELGKLLTTRADMLTQWAEDDSIWKDKSGQPGG